MPFARLTFSGALIALMAGTAGCGTSPKHPTANPASATTTTAASTTSAPAPAAAGALTAEAQAAAAGDIPDNQVFLEFRSPAGYSIKYPEGWLQQGKGPTVTFADKNNRIRIVLSKGRAFSAASVRADLTALKAANASFQATSPSTIALPAKAALKVSYTTESAPNPVTNKRVTLAVDRYYLSRGGKRAILDLGAPKGVDNVDAFRLIAQSFRWR
jgi:hypothetical protein